MRWHRSRRLTIEPIKAAGGVSVNARSFARSLKADNVSSKTEKTHLGSINRLVAFLGQQGMSRTVSSIRREHVEAFITALLERWKPAAANNRFRGLQRDSSG